MTMGDETPVTSLVLPVILRPILTKVLCYTESNSSIRRLTYLCSGCNMLNFISQLERQNVMAAQTLRAALTKAESSHPGITYDLIMGIIRRAELNLDMNESVLRLQGAASDYDGKLKCNTCIEIISCYINRYITTICVYFLYIFSFFLKM